MSQENVAVVQGLVDASGRRDLDAIMAALDPAIEWTPVESDPGYSVHRGHDDVRAWLAEWFEALPDMRWDAERILVAGDEAVVALVRMAGRGAASGLDVKTPTYGVVFTVQAGKVVRIEEYADRHRALEAVGLSE
jgi:ketosteroid isomerase-like protein